MELDVQSSLRLHRGEWPFLGLLKQSFAAHGLFILILAAYMLCLAGLAILHPGVAQLISLPSLPVVAMVLTVIGVPVLVACKLIEMAIHESPARPALRLFGILRSLVMNGATWARGIPMFFCLCLFMVLFGHIKASITVVHPFAMDQTLDHWDKAIHLGHRPWEWLQPFLGYPVVTHLIDIAYILWFFVLLAFWLHYAFLAAAGERRTHFFLSFMLSWMIGGSLLALLLSSAGPCYFGRGGLGYSPDPYEGLMAYLNAAGEAVPLRVLGAQKALWSVLGETMPFGGVSAMPSMHNGSALLFLLFSAGLPLFIRYLLLVHFVVIFLGSVHLAWHYAVDAYVAWAVVLAVWYATGPLARWWESRPDARAFREALEARQRHQVNTH